MPIGITSPAKNLFLIGSTGASSTQDFLNRITPDGADSNQITPTSILYDDTNQELYIAGTQRDATSSSSEGFIYNTPDEAPITIDFTVKLKAGDSFSNVVFNALCYDSNLNLYAAGSWDDGTTPTTNRNYAPTLSKFNSAGEHQWTITPVNATGDLDQIVFNDVCADTYGNVYVTGVGNDSDKLYIAKYDTYGTVLWYKSYTDLDLDSFYNFEGRSIDINSQNELVIVGTALGPAKYMSVMLKVSTDGALLWDKTIEIGEDPTTNFFQLTDVHIDGNDQIYLCGHDDAFLDGTYESYVIKMTKEGNMLWQTKTKEPNKDIFFQEISVDTLTGQSIVAGYVEEATNAYQIIQRYDNAGELIWTRKIQSPNNQASSTTMSSDPSYYYIAFADQTSNAADPTSFLFGKLSVTGSGLGDFNYSDGAAVQTYEIITINTETATLRDGSLRNDSSDFITYPFSPIKVVFGENAGGNLIYSDKKPQHETNTHDITFASETIIQSSVPPVSASDISRGNALLLNYEFDNEFTYDPAHNLIPNGNQIGGAGWSNPGGNSINLTTNNPSPSGENVASTWTGPGYYEVVSGTTDGTTYTMSVYAKQNAGGSGGAAVLQFGSDTTLWGGGSDKAHASFNLATGTVTGTEPGVVSAGVEDVGNGWYRCYVSGIKSGTGDIAVICYCGNQGTGATLYAWGAQLEASSTLNRHVKTSGTAIPASTTVKNLSSTSYTGTINEPTFSPNGYFEHEGTAQTAGSIYASNSGLPTGSSPRTMEAWVYMDTLGAGGNPGFLTYGNDAAGQQSGLRYVNTGLQVSFWTGTYDFNTGYDPGFAHFFHYVATYDNNDLVKAYVNGSIIGQKDLSATPLNTVLGGNLMLFRVNEPPSGPNYYPHDGRIGEVRIYNVALDEATIYKNYLATRHKYPAPDLFVSGLTTTLVSQHLGGYSDFNTETSLVDSSLSGTDISIDTNAGYSLTTFNGLEVVRVDETTAQLGSFTNLSSLPTGTSWSCAMWVYYDAANFDNEGHRTFFSSDRMRLQWDNAGTGNIEGLWKGELNIGGSPVPSFETANTDGYNETLTIANFLNRWNHVMYTSDGTNVKLYWDGTLQSTVAVSCAFRSSSTAEFGIGYNISSLGGGDSIERETGVGYIGGFNIWSSALSSGEAGIVFESERRRYGV